MKRRALLAWEHGAGRGHVVSLLQIAQALGDRYAFDAALCRMQHADELRPVCDTVMHGAALSYDSRPRQGAHRVITATWGEFLGDLGFRDPTFLSERIAWWQDFMLARHIELVIADYAPLALLAARIMGIPAIATCPGYGLPPHGLERFPVYLPEHAECLYDEAEMVEAVNRAGDPLGLDPIATLPEIYACESHIVRTLPVLDPYDGLRRDPLCPPYHDIPRKAELDEAGDEVFVYFSTTEADDPGVIEAVAGLGLPTRAFAPGLDAAAKAQLAAGGVIVEPGPVPIRKMFGRSRVLLHSGPHGTLCAGLAAGLPQVSIPQHLEHLYHARKVAELGCGVVIGWEDRSAAAVRAAIRAAYADTELAERARDLAAGLPRVSGAEFRDTIRQAVAGY